jgi:preprotein translocase subunit SecG
MVQVLLVVHLLIALAIIGLVLLQQGKGAEAGASFGAGASQTIFGSAGSWNFFSRMTAIFATLFFVTSISLAVVAKRSAVVDDPALPKVEQKDIPVELPATEIPVSAPAETKQEIPVLVQPNPAEVPADVLDKDSSVAPQADAQDIPVQDAPVEVPAEQESQQ